MESLTPGSKIDRTLRILMITTFLAWNLFYGAAIHTPYPKAFVTLFIYPIWRLLMVLLIVAGTLWCPRVGLMVSLAVFFYFMDIPHFITPWQR